MNNILKCFNVRACIEWRRWQQRIAIQKLLTLPIKVKRCHVGFCFFSRDSLFTCSFQRKKGKEVEYTHMVLRSFSAISFNNKLMILSCSQFRTFYRCVYRNAASFWLVLVFHVRWNRIDRVPPKKLLTNLCILISSSFMWPYFVFVCASLFHFDIIFCLFFSFLVVVVIGVCFHFGCI